jgi:hypothetical protein
MHNCTITVYIYSIRTYADGCVIVIGLQGGENNNECLGDYKLIKQRRVQKGCTGEKETGRWSWL